MTKKIVKYEIQDYTKLTNEQLIEKMEMYLGKMTLIEFKRKESDLFYSVKDWFSCSLNMYNISQELRTRLGNESLDSFNPQLN